MYSRIIWLLTLGLLFFVISFFHIRQLGEIPRGLYLDESSIGYNAALISHNGIDEHGKRLPIFFEAFGEYKNPLYIYTTALLFKLTSISIFSLRLTSFLFFSLFLLGIFFLASDIFKNKLVIIFALLSAGFLPWFFNLSRIAFETVSQITIVIFALFFIHRTFSSKNHLILNPLAAGFFLGLSYYTYSTARLLTPLFLLSLFIIYFKYFKKLLIIIASFVPTSLPYIYFSIVNPGALTRRFHVVTYIYGQNISYWEKLGKFFENYFNYISPTYLFLRGDTSPRHHTGISGELYVVVFLLTLAFLIYKVKLKSVPNKFQLLLLLNLIFAPIAAALTTGDSSLRSILVGLYFLIFSFFGLNILLSQVSGLKRLAVVFCVFSLLFIESARYLRHYFTEYPKITVWAFESYGFNDVLDLAYDKKPEKIIVSNTLDQTGIHYRFYSQMKSQNNSIIILAGLAKPSVKTCLVFPYPDKNNLDKSPIVAKFTDENGFYTLRCY